MLARCKASGRLPNSSAIASRKESSRDRSSRPILKSATLSFLLKQPRCSTLIRSSDDQFGRRLVINTRHSPVWGLHRLNSSSFSQLSNTSNRGREDCQAEHIKCTFSSSDKLLK